VDDLQLVNSVSLLSCMCSMGICRSMRWSVPLRCVPHCGVYFDRCWCVGWASCAEVAIISHMHSAAHSSSPTRALGHCPHTASVRCITPAHLLPPPYLLASLHPESPANLGCAAVHRRLHWFQAGNGGDLKGGFYG
jgi:hypothetical protein